MRRFNYEDNDEFRDEIDRFLDSSDDYEYMEEGEASMIQMIQVDLASLDLNQKLLLVSLKILEKTLFWRFRSLSTKLKMITETYNNLETLVQGDHEEEEAEEKEKEDG